MEYIEPKEFTAIERQRLRAGAVIGCYTRTGGCVDIYKIIQETHHFYLHNDDMSSKSGSSADTFIIKRFSDPRDEDGSRYESWEGPRLIWQMRHHECKLLLPSHKTPEAPDPLSFEELFGGGS